MGLACSGTALVSVCGPNFIPSTPWWNERELIVNTSAIDALAIRVTGNRAWTFRRVETFGSQTIDNTTDNRTDSVDYVAAVLPSWGSLLTDQEIQSDVGLAGIVQRGDFRDVFGNGTLFVQAVRVVGDDYTILPQSGLVQASALVTSGAITSTLTVTPNAGCIAQQQRVTGPTGPRNTTTTETIRNTVLTFPSGLSENYQYTLEAVSPDTNAQGFPQTPGTVTETTTYTNAITATTVLRFGELPGSWTGPAGYDVCNEIASVVTAQAVDANAAAIEIAQANDPLRTCRGCGG